METKNIIVGIGEILWDLLPSGKVLGGAPANFAYHANQLGGNGYVISAIGDDMLGNEIIKVLEKVKLNFHLDKLNYPTGTVKVQLSDKGIPEYEISEDVAWDNIILDEKCKELANYTSAVCFGTLAQRNIVSRNTIQSFIQLLPAKALKIFDINLRQKFYTDEIIQNSLTICNILKINDEELEIVSSIFGLKLDPEKACLKLIEMFNLEYLALTCGTKGSFLFSANSVSFLETPIVEVIDTVGAGDSFTAGMTIGLLNNKSLRECHDLAVNISAYVCTQSGAMPEYSRSII